MLHSDLHLLHLLCNYFIGILYYLSFFSLQNKFSTFKLLIIRWRFSFCFGPRIIIKFRPILAQNKMLYFHDNYIQLEGNVLWAIMIFKMITVLNFSPIRSYHYSVNAFILHVLIHGDGCFNFSNIRLLAVFVSL